MKSFHLAFHESAWPDTPVIDLINADEADLPTDAGAYVLGTADGTMLVYPWATSPIFYIGKARNLRLRLFQHKQNILYAIENHDEYYRPRHQYGAALGAHAAGHPNSRIDELLPWNFKPPSS